LVAVVLVFLAYGVFGQWIEGPFSHRALSLREMLDQLVFTSNGLFGSALHVAAFLVFVFVTFGALLDRCGGGDFFSIWPTAWSASRSAGRPRSRWCRPASTVRSPARPPPTW